MTFSESSAIEVVDQALSLLPEKYAFIRDGMFGLQGYVTFQNQIRHGRFSLNDKNELLHCLISSKLHNCFLSTHSPNERSLDILSLLFFDIDCEGSPDLAIKYAMKTSKKIERKLGVVPLIQISGFKGCHLLLPAEPKEVPKEESKEYLKWLQLYLSDRRCDSAILGDSNRLFRLPNTLNTKLYEDLQLISRPVKTIQTWDGKRADLSLLYGDFVISKVQGAIKAKELGISRYVPNLGYEWIDKLLSEPISDGRKLAINLAIAPYLIKIKGLSPNESSNIINAWLNECSKLRGVDYKARYLARQAPFRIAKTKDVRIISRGKFLEMMRRAIFETDDRTKAFEHQKRSGKEHLCVEK